jgi:hypothetical protein
MDQSDSTVGEVPILLFTSAKHRDTADIGVPFDKLVTNGLVSIASGCNQKVLTVARTEPFIGAHIP